MTNKFGRDDRYRDDRYRGEEYRRDREAREPFWRGIDEDRGLRSPDQEFETSANYRQPGESPRDTYSSRQQRYGFGYGRPSYGGARFDGVYAPSYGWSSEVRGGHSGRGPKGYTRSDERIREDVCERLSWDDEVDATDISVRVEDGEVTLEGSVETRHMKRLAVDLADDVPGVQDVHSTIRVRKPMLTELKEKITGHAHEHDEHYANTGTRMTSGSGSTANGRP